MKMNTVENFYNMGSMKLFADEASDITLKASKVRFGDSISGSVLERTLTAVDPTIFTKKYPANSYVNALPVSNIGDSYAKRIQSLRLLGQGGFSFSGDDASNKGKISLSGEDSDILVYEKECFIEWNTTQVAQASQQGYSLQGMLMSKVDEKYKQEVDGHIANGIGANLGLLNNGSFGTTAVGANWSGMDGATLYATIADGINAQADAVGNTPEYKADTATLPIGMLNKLRSTVFSTTGDSPASVLSALNFNFPGFNFVESKHNTNGNGGADAVSIFKGGNDTCVTRLPLALEVGAIIQTGSFSWKADAKYRLAGVEILEKTAGWILTGLSGN
jgi:hypothetical protein